ncbi:MAG: class I SAM-dependent methyltransferase [Elusimicrobia bacterium]|nr:class I SAM-dependent methyltransferase [Elusimicrobiota bacterium]
MERILLNTIYPDASVDADGREHPYDPTARAEGRVWPTRALTMIGEKRLHHLRRCVEEVLADDISGDLLEAGVWRGGASIMMRAVLAAHGVTARRVWVADSFRGLPPPNSERYPLDAGLDLSKIAVLAVPREVVQTNFEALGLMDDNVRFVEGWFSETLTTIDADAFALLRLDGDLYESTLQTLEALYPKLSAGGFLVVDDYGAVPACAAAVHDFREWHRVTEPIETIDWTGVYWRKSS